MPTRSPVRVRTGPFRQRDSPKSVIHSWPAASKQEVGRLDVATNNPKLVGVIQCLGGLQPQLGDESSVSGTSLPERSVVERRRRKLARWQIWARLVALDRSAHAVRRRSEAITSASDWPSMNCIIVMNAAVGADGMDRHNVRVVQMRAACASCLKRLQLPGV